MPYWITQCYLPPDRDVNPTFAPSRSTRQVRLATPEGCKAELHESVTDMRKTRGSNLRLQKFRSQYDMRKFYFRPTNRVVDRWNSLPNWVVSANNNNAFITVGRSLFDFFTLLICSLAVRSHLLFRTC